MDKRKSSKYIQHNGSIPKKLSILVRMLCLSEKISLSQATEEALILWVNCQKEKISQQNKIKTEFSKSPKSKIYEKDNSFIKKDEETLCTKM